MTIMIVWHDDDAETGPTARYEATPRGWASADIYRWVDNDGILIAVAHSDPNIDWAEGQRRRFFVYPEVASPRREFTVSATDLADLANQVGTRIDERG